MMTSARGSLDLLRRELVVGIALIVMRWYDGSALRVGLCENDAFRVVRRVSIHPLFFINAIKRKPTFGGKRISGGFMA